jgi:hypothetical protein
LIYTAIIFISSFNYTLGQRVLNSGDNPPETNYIKIKFKESVEYSTGFIFYDNSENKNEYRTAITTIWCGASLKDKDKKTNYISVG